jgi:hypothetical protein
MARVFQFSIRGLLVAVTFLAVGIAALINANGIWLGLSWGLVLYALTAAVLLVGYRRNEPRAFWLGFAVFGWLYLALFLLSLAPAQLQFWVRTDPLKHNDLLATQVAQWAHQSLLPESRRVQLIAAPNPPPQGPNSQPGGMGSDMMASMMGSGSMPGGGPMSPAAMMGGAMDPFGRAYAPMVDNPNYVPIETFTHTFHAFCLLLVAAIGGKTCQFIYRTRPSTEE